VLPIVRRIKAKRRGRCISASLLVGHIILQFRIARRDNVAAI
jgi:hypothetical protein